MKKNKQDLGKYGQESTDPISVNYKEYGAGFICGNLLKLITRIENVSKMSKHRSLFYRLFLCKGGRHDFRKINVYFNRLENLNSKEYRKWVIRINDRLDGLA